MLFLSSNSGFTVFVASSGLYFSFPANNIDLSEADHLRLLIYDPMGRYEMLKKYFQVI